MYAQKINCQDNQLLSRVRTIYRVIHHSYFRSIFDPSQFFQLLKI